jgi:hypothetical protein
MAAARVPRSVHGAKFEQFEWLASIAGAHLPE